MVTFKSILSAKIYIEKNKLKFKNPIIVVTKKMDYHIFLEGEPIGHYNDNSFKRWENNEYIIVGKYNDINKKWINNKKHENNF